jgi:uncharacterized Zn finger protein
VSWRYGGYRDYVPVRSRIAQARTYAKKRAAKQGRELQPVSIEGTKIAKTFWGKAWCEHLESYSDFSNRLPRGRTYARNGSVVDLKISAGQLEAIVGGSEPYEITIRIDRLKPAHWKKICSNCAMSIDSLLDLLGGRLSDGVMERLTDRRNGLFPSPNEISLNCDCPDGASLCKHLAAVLYGVGARLDQHPELLFLLRDVDHHELISKVVSNDNLNTAFGEPSSELAGEDLGALFGIELDSGGPVATKSRPTKSRPTKSRPAKGRAAARSTQGQRKTKKRQTKKKSAKRAGVENSKRAKPGKKKVARKKAKVTKKAKKARSPVENSDDMKPAKKKVARKKTVRKKSSKKKTAHRA